MTDHLSGPVATGRVVSHRPGAPQALRPEAGPAPIFWPDAFAGGEDGPSAPDATRAVRHRTVVYGLSGAVAVLGAVAAYAFLAPGSRQALRANERAGLSVGVLDAHADTAALALSAFELRAAMFDRRQVGCPTLANGLVQIESEWIAYNLARRAGAAALDPARVTRDSALFSRVKAAEQVFQRSKCTRP